jgi:hypothetical protein
MAAGTVVEPQALGAVPVDDERGCMFCGERLENRGPAFIDHIQAKVSCREAYEAWLERLDEDRPGG